MVSILERLEQEPWGLSAHSEAKEISIEEVTQKVRRRCWSITRISSLKPGCPGTKEKWLPWISNVIIFGFVRPKAYKARPGGTHCSGNSRFRPLDELPMMKGHRNHGQWPHEVFVERTGCWRLHLSSFKRQAPPDIINRIVAPEEGWIFPFHM